MDRRQFLKLAGGAVGASVLGCGGLAAWGMKKPAVEFAESSCDGGTGRVLVAYASLAGSTGEVAEAIGRVLCAGGAAMDVRRVQDVADPSEYRAVVLGSAIRMGRLLPEMVSFVEKNASVLQVMPTAYFVCCGILRDDTQENRDEASGYLDPVRQVVGPVGEGLFAGKIDYGTIAPLEANSLRMLEAPEGDWRDWEAIRAWAGELAPVLLDG